MIVVLTSDAEADIESISDFIAKSNPARAIAIGRELRIQCNSLDMFAERYPLLQHYANREIRRMVHGDYLIFYRVVGTRVEILHILHGAMDYESVLFPRS